MNRLSADALARHNASFEKAPTEPTDPEMFSFLDSPDMYSVDSPKPEAPHFALPPQQHPPESVARKLAKTTLGGVAAGAAVVAAAGLIFATGGIAAIPLATWLIAMAIGGGAGFIGRGLREMFKGQPAQASRLTKADLDIAAAQPAKPFRLDNDAAVKAMYATLTPARINATFTTPTAVGGAATVGADIYAKNPSAKIGVMIAANSGLPGGDLGYNPGAITRADLARHTQEESVWANAALTMCGTDSAKQQALFSNTIAGKWGLLRDRSVRTVQRIDFTRATDADAYNRAYTVEGLRLSGLNPDGSLLAGGGYPVHMTFADSVNAGDAGQRGGTMQRTRNAKAAGDYGFFRDCVKAKLRSAIDAEANARSTHLLVARLSAGIYAGSHKDTISGDFYKILQEVLDEPVGPKGESRGQYFKQVVVPKVQSAAAQTPNAKSKKTSY